MKTIYGTAHLPRSLFQKPVSLCLGVFDGVHRGHARIILNTTQYARQHKMKSVVLTFYPHPLQITEPDNAPPLLISLPHRLYLLEQLGVDITIVIRFNKVFSRMLPEHFFKKILMDKLHVKNLFVGEDFFFGFEKRGDIVTLHQLAQECHITLFVVKSLKIGKGVVSSTRIRNCIQRGDFKEASRFLGRPFSIVGKVVKGTQLGRYIGFPTANINPYHEVLPPAGVYAVYVWIDNARYHGALNIGIRPTVGECSEGKDPILEVHIFDFTKDIYHKHVEIEFVRFIRKERKFVSLQSLTEQILRDEKKIRNIFLQLRNVLQSSKNIKR